MKKLILVTLTALAASWLLAEARRMETPRPLRPVSAETRTYRPVVREVPEGPGPIRVTEWNKANHHRPKPEPVQAPKPASASAKVQPPAWFPKSELDESAMARPDDSGFRVIVGRVSASEERAKADLRQAVERAVTEWLAADVATSWKVPPRVLGEMVRDSYTQQVTRNLIKPEAVEGKTTETPGLDGLYTLYRAGQKLDFSPSRKARIVAMYRDDLARQRMHRLGGGIALALVSLAVLSSYIKADEATKGYYTNRLRFLAAAGMGAAGVVAYRLWV